MAAIYEGKIGFLKNEDAVVYTHAKPTLSEFIQQRKRWASKSTRYKDKLVIVSFTVIVIIIILYLNNNSETTFCFICFELS